MISKVVNKIIQSGYRTLSITLTLDTITVEESSDGEEFSIEVKVITIERPGMENIKMMFSLEAKFFGYYNEDLQPIQLDDKQKETIEILNS